MTYFPYTLYNRCTVRRKQYTSKTNRKKPVCYGKEHESDSHEFWWTFVFTDERKFMLFKSGGQEKLWRQKNCELDDKNLTGTILNTMDNVTARALNGLGNLCFIDGTMDHYLYINILKSHFAKS